MTTPEETAQRLDPLGALSGRRLTIVGAIIAYAYASVATVQLYSQTVRYDIAVAALLTLAAACVALVSGASPTRAPFTRFRQWVVLGTALLAYLLSVLSQWGLNESARDDWGPVALGVIILALAPFRPSQEILRSGIVASALVAVGTAAQVPHFDAVLSPAFSVIIAVTPVVGMTLASSAFSRAIIGSLAQWRAHVTETRLSRGGDVREAVARSVQQNRVTILNRDVVPFLADVLGRDSLSEHDNQRARQISDSIRRVMVLEAERSWLDELMESHARSSGAARTSEKSATGVTDDERLAELMNPEQRAALRALLLALSQNPALDPGSLRIAFGTVDGRCSATLTAAFGSRNAVVRAELAPYFAVFRAVFDGVRAEYHRPTLAVKFCYAR